MIHLIEKFKLTTFLLILTTIFPQGHCGLQTVGDAKNETFPASLNIIRRNRRDASVEELFEMEDTVDPFADNVKWYRFVLSVEQLAGEVMKNVQDYLTTLRSSWTASSTELTATNNSGGFESIANVFKPIHAKLERNAAYRQINPRIDLPTIEACIEFAIKNSTKLRDQTRFKWIEINAMATTIHHAFDQVSLLCSEGSRHSLSDVIDAAQIPYPTWLKEAAIRKNDNTFESMDVNKIEDYINSEILVLGDNYHLIRGLERILRQEMMVNDPRKTDYNFYCYGNNEYGVILDQFDILTDATLYLSLADIKYAVIQMIRHTINDLIEKGNSRGDKANVSKLAGIIAKMVGMIANKTRFENLDHMAHTDVVTGPMIFKCDIPPLGEIEIDDVTTTTTPSVETTTTELPSTTTIGRLDFWSTSPYCPPTIFMRKNEIYSIGVKVDLPTSAGEKVVVDGEELDCIKMTEVGMDPNGKVLSHSIKDGVCVDDEGAEVPECVPAVIPIFVSKSGVPIPRSLTPGGPSPFETVEWGKLVPSATESDEHPLVLEPQAGPRQEGPQQGYLDNRTPLFDSTTMAQFTGAFGGYVESELVLSSDGRCGGTCEDYFRPTPTCDNKTTHCDLFRKSHCEPGKDCLKESTCSTKAKRCVRAAPQVQICPNKLDGNRLYEWISLGGKRVGGPISDNSTSAETIDAKDEACKSGEVMSAKERWDMEDGVILNTPEYCELCLCVCEDAFKRDGRHYFDLTPAVSDVSNGFVVTAVKFHQERQTMRLVIEEGQLVDGEQGKIDATTLKQQEIAGDSTGEVVPLGSTGFKKMNLDIAYAVGKEVVSGVRFRLEEDRLELDVQFVKIDKTGVVQPPVTEWRSPNWPLPTVPRKKVDLMEALSPIYQHGPSQPFNIPKNSEFIEFDATSLEKEAGQAVVPFFDLQAVQNLDETEKRPLISVGILYKSKRNSGGFISPVVAVFDGM